MRRAMLVVSAVALAACGPNGNDAAQAPAPATEAVVAEPAAPVPMTVSQTPTTAAAADGTFISWKEHLIDDEALSGVRTRGADGLVMADLDGDGFEDIVSANEDSHHVRVAFGSADPDEWASISIAEGPEADTVEDVAAGDVNGDGSADVVIAAERAHLLYIQNPGEDARERPWGRLVVPGTTGRGSWIRVFLADFDGNGTLEVVGANKGIVDAGSSETPQGISLFHVSGDPLLPESWREETLITFKTPINCQPVDIDGDGDLDILAGSRGENRMVVLENVTEPMGPIAFEARPVTIVLGQAPVPEGWVGEASAFNAAFADLDGDGRLDFAVNLGETWKDGNGGGWAWLEQGATLAEPWTAYRIGEMLPDLPTGLAFADIDGDGDLDLMSGSYSGFNILEGGFSGDPRDHDGEDVTASSSVGRIAWYENPGAPGAPWTRHDVTRRVRGMYDSFAARDLDGDGDVDFIGTRGNSGSNDGVFWLEQVRSPAAGRSFFPARTNDSADLPLPPADWMDHYKARHVMEAPPS